MKSENSHIANADLSLEQLHDRINEQSQRIEELEHASGDNLIRLRSLSAALKLGFWEWDEVEGFSTFYSPEMAVIFGVSMDELKTRLDSLDGFFGCVHPDDLEHYKINNKSPAAGSEAAKAPRIFEYRIIWPNGEVRQLREIYFSVYDNQGTLTNTYGAVQDITEQQHALTALKQSEEIYSSLFNQMPMGVQEQDYSQVKRGIDQLKSEGVTDFRRYFEENPEQLRELVGAIQVTNANLALLKIHRSTSVEEFITVEDDVASWWNEQWLEYFISEIETYTSGNEYYYSECIDEDVDDNEIIIRVISSVVSGHEDSWERVISIIEDITEQKQNELDLIESRNIAEQASKAKTEFLSNMSHELRTPLNAIIGFSQLFEYDKSLSEKALSYARDINKAGDHLLSLIDDVLDLARIEAGKIELSMETVKLEAAIEESMTWVVDMAQDRGISVYFEPGPGHDIFITADALKLKQVLLNLMTNAVKYNKEKGWVKIKCHRDENNLANIVISDNGFGIPAHRLDELFQPFSRLGAEKGAVEGTGIGLVITQQLINLMGGEIHVHSVEGEGSIFTLQFQAVDASAYSKLDASPVLSNDLADSSSIKPTGILVAEDNLVNQEVLSAQMEVLGYQADFADNGVEALALWCSDKYRVLLTDIRMPKMDGYELIRQIRASETEGVTSTIVAVTANAMQSDIDKCLEIGANDVLAKPVTLNELKEMLEKWIV